MIEFHPETRDDKLDKGLCQFVVDADRRIVSFENGQFGKEVRNDPDQRIKIINEWLEGKSHPDTGVPYVRKTVEDADGNEVNGVFPEFESFFDLQLPEYLLQSSDREQFAECNRQLKDALQADPDFIADLSSVQREQIINCETPDGYTWHHNEEKGKMQLVDSDVHALTRHTGGRAIWGGGKENR